MKFIKHLRNIFIGLYSSIRRFPLTILFSICIGTILIVINETSPAKDTLSKIAMVLALGIPLSLSIKLYFERSVEKSTFKFIAIYFISFLLLILYYFFLLKDLEMVSITRYTAVTLALYLTFIFIPYISEKDGFELYVIKIITSFFTTLIYSLVLYGGLSAILFSIDKLLGINVLSKVYYYTFLFVIFIFAVSYFLSGIPAKKEEMSVKNYPKLLRVLLLYIVIPLLTAYTTILYIYLGKIIFTMHWPVGMVSHLVLWYSIIVTITLFFLSPIIGENLISARFLAIAPKVLIPLLLMMFISIGIRIKAYGITEPRYFVVILALWVFGVMLYFSFRKKLNNIVIPITLSLIAIFSVFGPLSSYSLSKYSQNQRFEKILIKNSMLQDGKIQSSTDISKEDKINISSILDYFNRNHNLNKVKYLPEGFKIEDMNKIFGFSYENQIRESPENFFYYTRSHKEKVLDIRGYDYLIDTRSLMAENSTSNKDINVSYNFDKSTIKISYKGNDIYSKDLSIFVKDIINKHVEQTRDNTLPDEEMIITDENNSIRVKFIFESISGNRNNLNDTALSKGIEFNMLVKVKAE